MMVMTENIICSPNSMFTVATPFVMMMFGNPTLFDFRCRS